MTAADSNSPNSAESPNASNAGARVYGVRRMDPHFHGNLCTEHKCEKVVLHADHLATVAALKELQRELSAERTAREKAEANERLLRKLLAFAYSGTHLYGDDGELQDSRLPFPIDYVRDTVEQIDAAIYNRGMAQLAAMQKERG